MGMKRALILVVVLLAVVLAGIWFLAGRGGDRIVVGGKKFTEGYVMSAMVTAVLRDHGYTVEERIDMGSGVVREAQVNGQVDLYWEYTGTAYVMHHDKSDPAVISNPQRVYDAVRRMDGPLGLVWLDPAPFNNTYTLLMTREKAEAWGIRSVSDLAAYVTANPAGVTLASNAEWFARPDGFQGLGAAYGFQFPLEQVVKMDAGLIYRALRAGEVDVGMGYSTDARIVALDLLSLRDNKGFFPIYNPAVVVRRAVLEKYPELAELLNPIARRLDEAAIARLNYQVDIEKQSREDVARAWLRNQGLL
jgi:osmoprotectant transport system substrate-binding protein